VTSFGLVFTPIFYVVCRWIAEKASRRSMSIPPPFPPPQIGGGREGVPAE
jgi:hypothetical protein